MFRERVANRLLLRFEQSSRPGVRHICQQFNARVAQCGDSGDRLFDGKSKIGVRTEGELHNGPLWVVRGRLHQLQFFAATDNGLRTNDQLFAILPPDRIEMGVIRLWPARQRHFLAGVELDAFVALNMQVAEEGAVPTGEREPGHRGWHTDIDTDHPGVEMPLELAGGVTAAGEDGGAIAEIALTADGERFI